MKHLLSFLILLALCSSCHIKRDSNGTDIERAQVVSTTQKNTLLVTGDWEICKMISDNNVTAYNVCPTINFAEGGTGYVLSPGGQKAILHWKIKDDGITLAFKSKEDIGPFFSMDTEFTMDFLEKDHVQFLELSNLREKYKFILSRSR